jgi:predicted outer membrane repeat protein
LKLANCSFTGNQASDGGAAAFLGLVNDHPSMENCTVSLNVAYGLGGGIYDDEANLSISETQFTGNGALSSGGGYFRQDVGGGMTFSSAVLSYCTFTGNVAAEEGGGAYNDGGGTHYTAIDHCVFIENKSVDGGGGLYGFFPPLLTNSIFINNQAAYYGGGYYVYDAEAVTSNCVFSGNSAEYGGGIYVDDYEHSIINSTFSNNIATNTDGEGGGGIYVVYETVQVLNCICFRTISANLVWLRL